MRVKKAPPEVLLSSSYSSKADVWAYAVLAWEVFSLRKAYHSLTSAAAAMFVLKGGRLEKPASCPFDVYWCLYNCWSANPKSRPSISALKQQLISQSESPSNSRPTHSSGDMPSSSIMMQSFTNLTPYPNASSIITSPLPRRMSEDVCKDYSSILRNPDNNSNNLDTTLDSNQRLSVSNSCINYNNNFNVSNAETLERLETFNLHNSSKQILPAHLSTNNFKERKNISITSLNHKDNKNHKEDKKNKKKKSERDDANNSNNDNNTNNNPNTIEDFKQLQFDWKYKSFKQNPQQQQLQQHQQFSDWRMQKLCIQQKLNQQLLDQQQKQLSTQQKQLNTQQKQQYQKQQNQLFKDFTTLEKDNNATTINNTTLTANNTGDSNVNSNIQSSSNDDLSSNKSWRRSLQKKFSKNNKYRVSSGSTKNS